MAIYHFSGTIIARSQGRSAVACAAYRSAERLYDERYACTRDYSRKQEVAYTEILLPEGAPEWLQDREKLWNAVERGEKRKDAQLAREFHFALPQELTLPQNIALARAFVATAFVGKGMVADLAVHTDKTIDGEPQPHAHVMLTLREVTADGFGLKVREWNKKEFLLEKREAWAEVANQHLARYDHDLRIDHRSYADQKIDLEPQHKIGAAQAKEELARAEDHQRIARENGEKLLADPTIALDALTRQQSTFTQRDVARFVNRHTVDAQQFQKVYAKVLQSPELVKVGMDAQGRERLTTQAMLALETQLLQQAEALSKATTHSVQETAIREALALVSLTKEQRNAFDKLVSAEGLSTVIGYAGTGKSYLLGAARIAWERSGYQVIGATLSGIAAQGLEGGSGIASRTVASRLYYWNKGEQGLTAKTVVVVDEAGMLGSRQMGRLIEEAHKAGAKIVQVGDYEQLQAIEAGAAFRGIAERLGYGELTEIRRQEIPWQQKATQDFAVGNTVEGLEAYKKKSHVHAFATQAAAQEGLIALWQDVRHSQPHASQIILAYTREETRQLNTLARAQLEKEGQLGASLPIQTERGERLFASGDRVYFLKNDRGLGVMNGTLGTLEKVTPYQLTVRLDRVGKTPTTSLVQVELQHYAHIDHGYAATIHKAQGVTVDRSYILASPYLDRHATYVAMTRHRQSADVFWSRDQFTNEKSLLSNLSRERAKDWSLDYGQGETVLPLQSENQRRQAERTPKNQEKERLEAFLREGLARAEREKKTIVQYGKNFEDFKTQFEAQYPEKAQQLQESTLNAQARQDIKTVQGVEKAQDRVPTAVKAIVETFSVLEKEAKALGTMTAQRHLGEYAANVQHQKEVMQYLTVHNKDIAVKIKELAKPFGLVQKDFEHVLELTKERHL